MFLIRFGFANEVRELLLIGVAMTLPVKFPTEVLELNSICGLLFLVTKSWMELCFVPWSSGYILWGLSINEAGLKGSCGDCSFFGTFPFDTAVCSH